MSSDEGVAAFVAARLDEDERRAADMQHEPDTDDTYYNCPATRIRPHGDLSWGEDACDCGLAARKGRALREVTALRAIVSRVSDQMDMAGSYAEADILRALAAIWSDHPGYRADWKPA